MNPSEGAAARLARIAGSSVRTQFASISDDAALASVGFTPVCAVVGAVSFNASNIGFYAPPQTLWASGYRVYTTSTDNRSVGTPSSVTAAKSTYRTALQRLSEEAVAAQADGVVGIEVSARIQYGSTSARWDVTATGTAVRGAGRLRAQSPFTTHLPGREFAASLANGWLPMRFVFATVMAIRAVDMVSRQQAGVLAGNGEVAAFTEVLNVCRHQARSDFAHAAEAAGADAAVPSEVIVSSRFDENAIAQVTILGTALGELRRRPALRPTLTVMPLGRGLSTKTRS